MARIAGLEKEQAHITFENYRARYNRVFDVESNELYHPKLVAK